MKVTLLASTQLVLDPGGLPNTDAWLAVNDGATSSDALAEFAGRACYQSWSRPNPATASTDDYLANVIALGHESVLAHASATFYVEGVSRSLTHELVRSRFLAFSELSQRYVNAEDFRPVYPPAANAHERGRIDAAMTFAVNCYSDAVEAHEGRGLTRKEARQAARAHLPLCTETKIVVSGNLRAWRDFLRQRLSPHADAEIRQLAEALLVELVALAPATFADAGEWSA